MSKTEIPSIRFHGFDDAWEQRKFGDDLISIQTGTNKLGSENGKGTPLLKMGNIQRGYFSLDKIEYLSDGDDVEPENIAYYGDFFFNTRNTLELVGKGATWTGNSGEYAFNSNIARFKLRELDTIFFNYLYNTRSMIEQVHARAMGTTSVAAIYPQSLKSIEYYVPTMAEQQRIGELLLKIDNLITFHQRKFEKLTNVKKSMLEKMFPRNGSCYPEIRFKGFTAPWEQRKFSDLADTRRGLTYNPSNIRDSGIRVLRSSNITEDRFTFGEEDVFVEPEAVNIPYANCGDILITSANGSTRLVGKHTIIREIPDNSAVHGGFMLLATAKNPEFVNALMSAPWYSRFISLYVAGGNGAIGNLNKNDLDEQDVFVPDDAEQKLIGKYFRQIDNLITLHQRELGKLQSIKKALLEKMFV